MLAPRAALCAAAPPTAEEADAEAALAGVPARSSTPAAFARRRVTRARALTGPRVANGPHVLIGRRAGQRMGLASDPRPQSFFSMPRRRPRGAFANRAALAFQTTYIKNPNYLTRFSAIPTATTPNSGMVPSTNWKNPLKHTQPCFEAHAV